MEAAATFAQPPSPGAPMPSDSEANGAEKPTKGINRSSSVDFSGEKQPPRQEDDISDEADSGSDAVAPKANNPATPGIPKMSPHLRLSEHEIRAQQQNLARQYSQLAQMFTSALERRVCKTLQLLEAQESPENKDENRKEKRRGRRAAKESVDPSRPSASSFSISNGTDTLLTVDASKGPATVVANSSTDFSSESTFGQSSDTGKYADNVAISRLGKLLIYQINSIRQNSQSEALSIWRDFTRQKMDLREQMSQRLQRRIMRLEWDHKESVLAASTDMSMPDWISANLDTVHLLRSQRHISGLDDADVQSDIRQMREGIAPAPPPMPPLPVSDSDSEEEVMKQRWRQDTEEVAETMVMCATQQSSYPPLPKQPSSPPLVGHQTDGKIAVDNYSLAKRRKTNRQHGAATKQAVEVIPSVQSPINNDASRNQMPSLLKATPQNISAAVAPLESRMNTHDQPSLYPSSNVPMAASRHGTTVGANLGSTNMAGAVNNGDDVNTRPNARSPRVPPQTPQMPQALPPQQTPQQAPRFISQGASTMGGRGNNPHVSAPYGTTLHQVISTTSPLVTDAHLHRGGGPAPPGLMPHNSQSPALAPTSVSSLTPSAASHGDPSRPHTTTPGTPANQLPTVPRPSAPPPNSQIGSTANTPVPQYSVQQYAYYPYQMVPGYPAQRYANQYPGQYPGQPYTQHYAQPYGQSASYAPYAPGQYPGYPLGSVPAPQQPSAGPNTAPSNSPLPLGAQPSSNSYVYGYPEQWQMGQISVPQWQYTWPQQQQ